MKGHQLNATSLQVPRIKARTTAKEKRVSLGKGYRPVNAASCVLGRKVMCQCRLRTTLIPLGSQTDVWVAVSWEAFSAITVKWNWATKQTRSLPISPPSPDQHCLDDGFFCCSVCLLVWSGAHGYPAWRREEKRRNEGCGGEVVVVAGSEGWGGGQGCVTHRPPLEVTRDLPGSYQTKLLNKYTQTPKIRATKKDHCLWSFSRCYFWHTSDGTELIHVNATRTLILGIIVHSKWNIFSSISPCHVQQSSIQVFLWIFFRFCSKYNIKIDFQQPPI